MRSMCSAGICASAQIQHRHVVGGGVRAGVARPQQAAERLARLIGVGQQRVKPVAALVVAGRLLLLECAVISVASTSIVNRSGAPCSSQNRSRARACAARSASSSPGSTAIRSITRNAVESDATGPNSAC